MKSPQREGQAIWSLMIRANSIHHMRPGDPLRRKVLSKKGNGIDLILVSLGFLTLLQLVFFNGMYWIDYLPV